MNVKPMTDPCLQGFNRIRWMEQQSVHISGGCGCSGGGCGCGSGSGGSSRGSIGYRYRGSIKTSMTTMTSCISTLMVVDFPAATCKIR